MVKTAPPIKIRPLAIAILAGKLMTCASVLTSRFCSNIPNASPAGRISRLFKRKAVFTSQ
jgi:hypothetical protein